MTRKRVVIAVARVLIVGVVPVLVKSCVGVGVRRGLIRGVFSFVLNSRPGGILFLRLCVILFRNMQHVYEFHKSHEITNMFAYMICVVSVLWLV